MQKTLEGDRSMWWFCNNEDCEQKLAKIIKYEKTIHPQILEIEGLNGQKFKVRYNYIEVFCHKCGTQNTLFGGYPFSSNKEWDENFKKWQDDGFDDDDDLSWEWFGRNPYKRNKLLKLLTENQKEAFTFLSKIPIFVERNPPPGITTILP